MESDVVIVGGGLTGLSVAHKLQQEGIECLLLEARGRFGGRILSRASGNSEIADERHDLGPSWIWPGQPRIARLVHELGLRIFPQYSSGTFAYEEADGSVRTDFNYSTMTGSLRIERGVASITDALVHGLGSERLLLSRVVTDVVQDGGGFRLTATTPDGNESIRARWVVLAAPPRVIENTITFDPPLPGDIANALRVVPTWMAGHAKLVAVYEEPFWRDKGLSGDGASRRGPLAEVHDATPASEQLGALFGFVGVPVGSPHRECSTLIDSALVQLGAMFGSQASSPVDVMVKDWANERFTATTEDHIASGHPAYGTSALMTSALDDRLLFASSEMGTQFGGLLEGALEAAELVVQEIVGARES